MKQSRRYFLQKFWAIVAFVVFFPVSESLADSQTVYSADLLKIETEEVAPGVFRIRAGEPEQIVPSMLKFPAKIDALSKMPDCKIPFDNIKVWQLARGLRIELPMEAGEMIYGLGLQCKHLVQNGWYKTLITNASDNGKGTSHAPVPFYISTAGYGVLIDNARIMSFSVGEKQRLENIDEKERITKAKENITDIEQLYGEEMRSKTSIYVDVPAVKGVDIYLFAGPNIGDAIARYNLYSGGGFLPGIAALGPEYLIGTMLEEKEALETCRSFKEDGIPITSIGLEPGWQTHAYSSSYLWNRKKFQEGFVEKVKLLGYDVSLWCQLYIDPSSPLIPLLGNKFGDFDVWRGLVPDMSDISVRNTYRDFLRENFIKKGIASFKLDEVDGSYNEQAYCEWMFPPFTIFPSGAEGDQARNLLGLSGQKSIEEAFRTTNKRTFGLVRASQAWAAPMPMSIYSDEYNFADYMRYNLSAGIQGVIWSPEVRHANNERDWAIRVAASAFSAKMTLNGWQFPHLPWKQPDLSENERHHLLPKDNPYTHIIKRFTRLRIALVPYLYTTYWDYHNKGISPVRPLVVDYPDDINTRLIDDEWMLGNSVLVAPITDENCFSDYIDAKVDADHFITDDNVKVSFEKDEVTIKIAPSNVGLKGGKLQLELLRGPARLRFLAKGDLSTLSSRMRIVKDGVELSDMGTLYKDNILITGNAWSAYSFNFIVPADGNYVLVLSKGYSLITKQETSFTLKDLCVEQMLGDKQTSWQRMVYLPEGGWRDFWTNNYYSGGKSYVLHATAEQPLVFVKDNTIMPFAEPVLTVNNKTKFIVNLAAYGDNPRPCLLFEDDGVSYNYENGKLSELEISSKGTVKRIGNQPSTLYKIVENIQTPEKVMNIIFSHN